MNTFVDAFHLRKNGGGRPGCWMKMFDRGCWSGLFSLDCVGKVIRNDCSCQFYCYIWSTGFQLKLLNDKPKKLQEIIHTMCDFAMQNASWCEGLWFLMHHSAVWVAIWVKVYLKRHRSAVYF